ncbi:DUF4184 family protein [Paenibacillus arenilitoris]|uniref:DUF4184 family protein n=1 Tax=Paenibacillus arenilitoris TaxID=2772299 RepID=A0A927CTC4_9BACL|nr:DUF4184 family protein [Paenibacillus arenilitoris]MBD2871210.1 DUF4184 family protein [Paenibacillus arenilitoris]
MPFTFSHALYAAPLKKAVPRLSATGLILGSFAPDFEYFIAMVPFRSVGHSIDSFILMAFPLCVALAFAFHRIVLPSLHEFLPGYGRIDRFAKASVRPWKLASASDWIVFFLSAFIGFISHLFLDNWTHASGWFVVRLPLLRATLAGDELYHILQLSLSALGIALPAYLLFRKWRIWQRANQGRSADAGGSGIKRFKSNWLLLLAVSFALFAGKLISTGDYMILGVWIVAPITASLVGLFAASLRIASARAGKEAKGWIGIFAILGAIALYKLAAGLFGFHLWLWILFIWILSAVILITTLIINDNN